MMTIPPRVFTQEQCKNEFNIVPVDQRDSSAPTGAVHCHLSPTTAGQWSTPSPVPVMMTGSNQDLVCRRKKFGNVRFVAFDYYNAEAFTFVTAAKEDADDFKTGLSFFQKK